MHPERKIVSINTVLNPKDEFLQINAVADDGSLWALSLKDSDDMDWRVSVTSEDWVRLPDLPSS